MSGFFPSSSALRAAFTGPKIIARDFAQLTGKPGGYDHTYVIQQPHPGALTFAAEIRAEKLAGIILVDRVRDDPHDAIPLVEREVEGGPGGLDVLIARVGLRPGGSGQEANVARQRFGGEVRLLREPAPGQG